MSEPPVVPFEVFMERALHAPRGGYYARRIRGVGRGADFTTAPMLSPALGQAIAAWAAAALRETGCRDLIEVGPGEGTLAAAVLRGLPWLVRRRTRLHLVESSAPLAEKQRTLLGRRARWHSSLAEALEAVSGRAVIYSNELVDAFPVRLFENTDDAWREIGVQHTAEGRLLEHLLPAADLPPSSIFQVSHRPGQRVEVHDSYRRWLCEWMSRWRAGRLLTIDYGAPAARLYQRRPKGSLRAYLLHHRIEGPGIYENPGRQDITADVNFSDLIEWSAPWTAGSRLVAFSDFIRPFADSRDPLLDPQGAGGAFQVLDQVAGHGEAAVRQDRGFSR